MAQAAGHCVTQYLVQARANNFGALDGSAARVNGAPPSGYAAELRQRAEALGVDESDDEDLRQERAGLEIVGVIYGGAMDTCASR